MVRGSLIGAFYGLDGGERWARLGVGGRGVGPPPASPPPLSSVGWAFRDTLDLGSKGFSIPPCRLHGSTPDPQGEGGVVRSPIP